MKTTNPEKIISVSKIRKRMRGISRAGRKGKLFPIFVLLSIFIYLHMYDGVFVNCECDDNHQLLSSYPNNNNNNNNNNNSNIGGQQGEVNLNLNSNSNSNSNGNDNGVLYYNQHQAQIDKLEEVVRNLSDLVQRLESKYGQYETNQPQSTDSCDNDKGDRSRSRSSSSSKTQGFIHQTQTAASVTKKYSPFWSEKFQFMSAVSLDSVATSVNVLPLRDYEGLTKYIAVGDIRGRIYIFLRSGDLLLEFHTLSQSPVTAMLSYMSSYMNETLLVTGHSNGLILVHRLWETSAADELTSLHIHPFDSLHAVSDSNAPPISILELHQVGRSKYILSVDQVGKIRVLRENGTLYGLAVPTSRPLVFLKQRLLFLTETGAGSLDLRTMKIRETDCEGLNDSVVKNYVFDATERSKAYGFTSSGDLIHVLLLGDVMNFKCRVRSRKKFDMKEPLAFQAIKGYLLIISQQKIHVYNVSTQHYTRSGAPRLTFTAGIEEIKSSFLPTQAVDENDPSENSNSIPLIASDREKLVVLGLGGGYVGMYQSKLPVVKGESNTMLWTSPVLFFILFLFGAWQFFAKKKEALTSWGPDDPFSSSSTSVTGGAPFADSSSRNAEIMDLRNSGLRGPGPSRRYTSPSRYPVDTGSRPSSVDPNPNYRATSELKFRASNLESSGFTTRRDMFVNSQVVDDGN